MKNYTKRESDNSLVKNLDYMNQLNDNIESTIQPSLRVVGRQVDRIIQEIPDVKITPIQESPIR